MFGTCLGPALDVSETCSKRVRDVFGTCSERVRDVFGTCSKRVRDVFGTCSRGRTQQNVTSMMVILSRGKFLRKCPNWLGHVRHVFGASVACVQEVFRVCSGCVPMAVWVNQTITIPNITNWRNGNTHLFPYEKRTKQ